MNSNIAKLQEWYRRPEQEILRREIRWSIRWFRRPFGLVFSAAFVGMEVYNCAVLRRTGYNYVLPAVIGLTVLGLWVYLTKKRSLAPLRSERFGDLYLTRLTGRDLWPALITSPVFIYGVFAFAEDSIKAVFEIAYGPPATRSDFMVLTKIDSIRWLVELVGRHYWVRHIAGFFYDIPFIVGLTAFSLASTLPRTSYFALMVRVFIGLVLFLLPQFLLAFATFGQIGIDYAHQVLWDSLIAPLFTIAIALLAFRDSIRRLHSARKWEKLRENAVGN